MAKKFYEYGPNDPVVSSVAVVGGATPTVDQNGVADLSTLFTSANTSNNAENVRVSAADATPMKTYTDGMAKYPINDAGTILDRKINVVSSGAFVIPEGFTDLLIRFTGTPTSLTFTDEGITDYGDDLPSESGDYLITVTKIDEDEAFIRVVTLEERS